MILGINLVKILLFNKIKYMLLLTTLACEIHKTKPQAAVPLNETDDQNNSRTIILIDVARRNTRGYIKALKYLCLWISFRTIHFRWNKAMNAYLLLNWLAGAAGRHIYLPSSLLCSQYWKQVEISVYNLYYEKIQYK